MKTSFASAALCLVLLACTSQQKESREAVTQENDEKMEEWTDLFDGKSLSGWRNFKSQTVGAAWKVEDGTLVLDRSSGEEGGDIITTEQYDNFELSLEWKIDSCGNSGVIFNVVEDEKYSQVWETGPEMQILDNACHPDAKIHKHRAGDLYDLIACSTETVKPAGEWNEARILSKNSAYEFYLNGEKVVSFIMHSPEWDELVKGSKFNDMAAFGKASKGHIALQDHGDKVWFRNIRIRKL